jgi:hypothetical protein
MDDRLAHPRARLDSANAHGDRLTEAAKTFKAQLTPAGFGGWRWNLSHCADTRWRRWKDGSSPLPESASRSLPGR